MIFVRNFKVNKMECIGTLYDIAGNCEEIKIFVPTNGNTITTAEMVNSISFLQRQVNETLTNKIGPNSSRNGIFGIVNYFICPIIVSTEELLSETDAS